MYPITEQTESDETRLAILLAVINCEDGRFESKVRRTLERQPSKADIAFTFGRVKGDAHRSDCMHKKFRYLTGHCRAAALLLAQAKLPAA